MTDPIKKFFEEHPEWKSHSGLISKPPSGDRLLELYPDCDPEVVSKAWEFVRPFITRSALYVFSRLKGQDDRFASIAAMQRSSRVMTDDVFWGGRKHFSEVYGEQYANTVKMLLAKQGVHLGPHDEYCPELAQRIGDPRAVVKGRGDIKRRCEEMGLACDGAVSVKAQEPLSDPWDNRVKMSESLIAESVDDFRASDPDGARKMDAGEIREHVIEKHASKV